MSSRLSWVPAWSASRTICSIARSALSAWTVVIDPGWPVLIARRKAKASAPRSSPRMIRSGRMRSEAASRSLALTCASPSALRAASRPTTLSWSTSSSGVSSIRISRSLGRDLADQGVEEGGLAGRGAARDEDVLARLDRGGEHAGDVAGVELRRQRPVDLGPLDPPRARLRLGEGAGGDIIVEREIGRDMLADRQRQRAARGRRRHHLHARAVGQGRREQGMLAADPLVGQRRDLPGEPGQGRLVERRRVVPLDRAAGRLDPELARPVDVDVGDVGPRQHAGQRRQIGAQIDALAGRSDGDGSSPVLDAR